MQLSEFIDVQSNCVWSLHFSRSATIEAFSIRNRDRKSWENLLSNTKQWTEQETTHESPSIQDLHQKGTFSETNEHITLCRTKCVTLKNAWEERTIRTAKLIWVVTTLINAITLEDVRNADTSSKALELLRQARYRSTWIKPTMLNKIQVCEYLTCCRILHLRNSGPIIYILACPDRNIYLLSKSADSYAFYDFNLMFSVLRRFVLIS